MAAISQRGNGESFPMGDRAIPRHAWHGLALASFVFVTTAVVLTLTAERATALEAIGITALGAVALLSVVLHLVRNTSHRAGQRYERPLTWLLHSSSDLVMVLDAQGTIVYLNPASERVLGRRSDHLVGGQFSELVHPEELGAVQALFSDLRARAGALGKSSWRMLHRDGSAHQFEAVVTNMLDDPFVRGIAINMHDVTQQRTVVQEAARSLLRDPLTGLGNRTMFHERLERAVAGRRRDEAHLAVVVIELAQLDALRVGFGREPANHALREIGTRIERVVRFEDIAARIADDQFAVLLERVREPEEVSAVAERITAKVREPIAVDGRELVPEAAIGVAISDGEDVAPDTLLNDADVAMYL